MTKRIRIFLLLAVLFLAGVIVFLVYFRPMVIPGKNSGEPDGGEISLSAQFPVYDKSCEWVTLVIENNSGETAEFGRPWELEKKVLGQWSEVPFGEIAFTSEAICLMSGGTWAQKCYLTHFIGSVGDGEYRIVKEIGDGTYYAEFEIGESVITSETPYGHEKLENLSLTPDEIPVSNAVYSENGELHNGEQLTEFLGAWNAHGMGYQLRSAYRGDEGQVVIEDVTILDDDKILWQCDTRRAPNGTVTQKYYSNIVTDGERLYLSDWNEYRGDGSERVLLNFDLPGNTAKEAVKILGTNFTRNVILYRWSEDGTFAGGIHDTGLSLSHYPVTGGSMGSMIEITRENLPDPDNFVYEDLQWTKDNVLMVMVRTDPLFSSPEYYYEFIDGAAGERISYTSSSYRYQWADGEIIIPE